VSVVVLLGPQRFEPTVRDVLSSLDVRGPIAAVTAGWQEREGEHDELRAHVDREVVDLALYHRHEDVCERDTELAAALRQRQALLREQQELYRMRLGHALEAARELLQRENRGRGLIEHRRAAIHAVRALDREHLGRLRRLHTEFDTHWRPTERPIVARHREDLRKALQACGAVAVAGGHVAVLVTRLRLFDMPSLVGQRAVVAWSAGAMAVSERIVLFHDSPPQGAGNAEVLDMGLALCRGVVPLPHAQRRLRLDDAVRVALFARRFGPAPCVVLDRASRLAWDGSRWRVERGTRALGRSGRLRALAGN
jgi:hypothetical protein